MVEVPVLYITFCRPEYARLSFDAIKRAQPHKLYFYSNKAREDRPDEVRRNEEVRAFVKEIDWDCDLKTWFRDEYVDVFTSLWGAIDWVFDNEEKAIIVEEDCVTSNAFYDYCEKLLVRYKEEKKIRLISGDNFTPEFNPGEYDYFFSHMTHIYGWASWRDKWKNMDRVVKDWKDVKSKKVNNYYPHLLERIYFKIMLNKVYNEIDTYCPWDFITLYNMINNDEVSIIPKYNLVTNIGAVGANSVVYDDSILKDVVYKENDYPVNIYPSDMSFIDNYDYPHFKKHILKVFVKYEIVKYWTLLFSRKAKKHSH